jgi:ribonuclease Y
VIVEIVVGIGALGAGTGLGLWLSRARARGVVALAQAEAKEILERARHEAETTARVAELEAKEAALKAKADLEAPIRAERAELGAREKRLQQKEESIDRRADLLHSREPDLERRDKALRSRETEVEEARVKYDDLVAQSRKRLEKLAGLTTDEARRQLIESLVDEARHEATKKAKQVEDEAREEGEKRAKRIIGLAIQRYAGEHVQERAVTVVPLPSDDMKGRIIGREGRNIRALEAATGVDLIIDDTPEAIILSSFDPIRREIARVTIEQLVADGRIHPTRIEEVLEKSRAQVEQAIREAGEQATFELGIHGMHPELVRLVGALKYRYSYAQNVWRHSIECGYLCGLMAAELGLNIKQARRAGLLHDIGKAVDHEVEGGHAVIGGALARKYGESPKVANAIASHHEDEEPESVLAHLVAAADALSGARPGARREMMESYIKRLEDLERIAKSFPGVEKTYAIQAGREIRVMVEQTEITDEGALLLSREIAKKIERELTYPGQIKVTVIRETRAVEYAR